MENTQGQTPRIICDEMLRQIDHVVDLESAYHVKLRDGLMEIYWWIFNIPTARLKPIRKRKL